MIISGLNSHISCRTFLINKVHSWKPVYLSIYLATDLHNSLSIYLPTYLSKVAWMLILDGYIPAVSNLWDFARCNHSDWKNQTGTLSTWHLCIFSTFLDGHPSKNHPHSIKLNFVNKNAMWLAWKCAYVPSNQSKCIVQHNGNANYSYRTIHSDAPQAYLI